MSTQVAKMHKKSVSPSTSEVAFDCPHCGAYTSQTWFKTYGLQITGEDRLPSVSSSLTVEEVHRDTSISQDVRKKLIDYITLLNSGLVFYEEQSLYIDGHLHNLSVSQCFVCDKFSVWVQKRLIFPCLRHGPSPNSDLPDDIKRDYDEASSIVELSPRGAAALLRLAIQKLCIFLGGKGKSIDKDIAILVKNGLSPMVQKALDAVRVIGNEAVHPGTMDLRDDQDIANKLFKAVNVIAEQMITNPNHVEEIYGLLPDEKRKQIDKRDRKA